MPDHITGLDLILGLIGSNLISDIWHLNMTAFNAVRFRVKPGREQEFLDAHKRVEANWPGLRHANMVKTGERTYCIIAEWSDMDSLIQARANMIATLDSFRDTLEDLGSGLGVTDPVSGPVVLALK
jgi:Antibiotic biosynthesis monooxygenase